MSQDKKEILVRLGEAFVAELLKAQVDFRVLRDLFEGGDSFLEFIKDDSDFEFAVLVLKLAGVDDDQLRDVARDLIGKCLASAMGAKDVAVTW